MSDAIVTQRLTKYYGRQRVVDTLDLRVPGGSVYGLLGRNGAGKSTTIKMLLGLVHPDRGRIQLLGEDAATLSPATRARIAYLAEGHPLYRWMTIGQAVRFARAFYPRWNGPLVEQILDHFGLSPKKRIRHLSRGQRAQVALALAVAPDPELLILDDPTIGLDIRLWERSLGEFPALAPGGHSLTPAGAEGRLQFFHHGLRRRIVRQIVILGWIGLAIVQFVLPRRPLDEAVTVGADAAGRVVDQARKRGRLPGPAGRLE